MKKYLGATLVAMFFTGPAQAQQVVDLTPINGWWTYQWGSTTGLVNKAKAKTQIKLNCSPSNQGSCTASNNKIYRTHFNIRLGPGLPSVAHATVDCQPTNAPVPIGHILILNCGANQISWNICPIHISQNK